MKRIERFLLPVALFFCVAGVFAADGDISRQNKPPVQVFYNPMPEEDVLSAMVKMEGDYDSEYKPINPMYSYTYISIFCDDTVIYYDQWEDGYEADMANPERIYSASNPSGTQIWGDGNPANGFPPNIPDDILNSGMIVKLENSIDTDKRGKSVFFDASDKWGSTKPVAASRTVWASQSKTLLAGANEMYDTSYFGTEFVCPCGTDTANQNEVFDYTGLMIMAGEGGATIEYSLANDNTADGTVKLVEGGTYLINGGMKQGGWVRATSGAVQVELITGDIWDNFESRFMKLLPRSMWNTSYTCPVATPKSKTVGKTTYKCGTKIWMYNPGGSSLSVKCYYRPDSGTSLKYKTIEVPAKSAVAVVAASGTDSASTKYLGAQSACYLEAASEFYAIATVDCLGTAESTSKTKTGDNRTWDWGFTLIPDSALSSQVVVGLGLGCDPNTTSAENAAPIWVSAPEVNGSRSRAASTTVYVRYDANTSTTPYTDEYGNKYDASYTLHPLEVLKIYNKAASTAEQKKNGQTGMTIWTLDGTKLAAAWGEDPETATTGDPGIDMGTGIPPMPEFFMQKSSKLYGDNDGDGFISLGDDLQYTIDIINVGRIPLTDITLGDEFSSYLSFIPGSLQFYMKNKYGVATEPVSVDDSVWNDIVSASGHKLTKEDVHSDTELKLDVGETWCFAYVAKIGDSPVDEISNLAWANNHYTQVTNSVTDFVRAKIGDYIWIDSNGNGVQDANEIPVPGITVSLVDVDGDPVYADNGIPYSKVTDENGNYLFIGVRPGIYKVKFDIPEVYLPTSQNSGSNDALDSDINASGLSDTIVVHGGDINRDVDAGIVVRDPHSGVSIEKTASGNTVNIGTSVTYTYKVTNTGHTYLHDVVVEDDKLGTIGTVSGVLAPGESAVLTKTVALDETTTNVGTVTGIPGNENGEKYPGVPEDPVTDSDDETVTVVDNSCWIGDTVWSDIDGDGVQDADEPGVSGVGVSLYCRTISTTTKTERKKVGGVWKNVTTTTVTTNLTLVATTTTDANGKYVFKGLDATVSTSSKETAYTVVFDNPDASLWTISPKDAGADDSIDSDAGADGHTDYITVASGSHDLTVDCGLVLQSDAASIKIVKTASAHEVRPGAEVTYTYDVTNTGKTYFSNVVVTDDKMPGQTKTIALIAPGETKSVTMSATISVDTTNWAAAAGTPSDENGKPYTKTPVVSEPDDETVTIILDPATVGDFVWVDVNGDGIQNDNFPMSGVTVKLIDADGTVAQTTTTDANGLYSFTVQPEELGTYTVEFVAPSGFTYTTKGTGTATDSDAGKTGKTGSIVLESGATRTDIDCGLVFNGNASVEIVKTAVGVADGETLTVEKGTAVRYAYKVTNTGSVALSNVAVSDDKLGAVGILEGVLLPGASVTLYKDAAAVNADVTNIGTVTGIPSSNDGKPYTTKTVTDADDAVVTIYELGSIGDFVWIDKNGNGIQDDGEPGMSGVTVKLTDSDGNVKTTTTDSNGAYLFDDLVPGTYKISFEELADYTYAPANQGGNDAKDSDATKSPTLVELASGENDTSVDCGLVFKGDASIKIVKTAGNASDGETLFVQKGSDVIYTYVVTNTGKTPLVDVTVTDDKLGEVGIVDGILQPGATATFTKAAAAVEADVTNVGSVEGTPSDAQGTPVSSETVTDTDDAVVNVYELGSIGDFVWIDVDGDGIQDEGEQGLSGVTVTLTDADGNVKTTTTDANGAYLFDDLVPGAYKISFEQPENFIYSPVNEGDDGEKDSDGSKTPVVVELASGEDDTSVDCGLVFNGDASIKIIKTAGNAADGDVLTVLKGSDVVYTYVVTNTGSVALSNVTVTDDKLGTVGTLDGVLLPGKSATLTKTAPAVEADVTNVGTVEGTPSEEDGKPYSSTAVTDNDDAVVKVYERGSIGDFVWVDVDGDGIQDDGEPGVEGVKVDLYAEGGDEPVATTTTDNDGKYIFEDVEPGNYYVVVTNPDSDIYDFTEQNAGEDSAVDSDVDVSGATEVFTLADGENKTDADAGLKLKDGVAAIDIVKLAGDAPDGATLSLSESSNVSFTIIVKNTGKVALSDVTVSDPLLNYSREIGHLAVGAAVTNEVSGLVADDIVNVATANGTPSLDDGTPISDTPVTDEDDASVVVTILDSRIGDRVWNDSNGNGVQDEGELGVYGITVELCDAETSNVVARVTTDANGGYVFENVPEGEYVIHFVKPEVTWDYTVPYADSGEELDSNADGNGWTAPFSVVAGKDDLTFDCGLIGGVPPGICELIDIASKFGAFVRGDLYANGGDSEGNLLVGGNAEVYDGFSVGLIGPGYGRSRGIAEFGTDAFVVAGNLNEGAYPDINGNVVYGGTYTNRYPVTMEVHTVEYTNTLGEVNFIVWTNWMGNADYREYDLRHVNPVTLDADFNVPEDGSGKTLDAIAAEIESFSEIVDSIDDTEGTSCDYYRGFWTGEQHDTLTLTGTDPFRNIFTITNETIVNGNFVINVPEGSKIVVNVLASDVSFEDITVNGANHPDRGVDYSKILFNFPNATNIVSKWTQFGAVIAPVAGKTTLAEGTAINGFGYFGGDVDLLGGSEFHDYVFKAFDCSRSDVVTERPLIDVVVTAGGAADGEVFYTVKGKPVVVTATIENVGVYDFADLVVNVFGKERYVESLAAGGKLVYAISVTPEEAGSTLWSASAGGYGVGSAPYSGILISDTDSATIYAADNQAEYDAIMAAKAQALNKGRYIERPDFAIDGVSFIGLAEGVKPSITGEVFSVSVTITNMGEVARAPGRVSVYVSGGDGESSVNYLAGSAELKSKGGVIAVGTSKTVEISGIQTPMTPGNFVIRVVVDDGNEVEELSEGNNHYLELIRLSPIVLDISIVDEGIQLEWNSFAGEAYVIYGSTDLETFEPQPIDEIVGKSYIEAEPPVNTVVIPFGSTEFKFFKLYADLVESFSEPL